MKTKVLLFGVVNAIILTVVLLGSPIVVFTTVIALGILGFQFSLFSLIFK